MPRHHNKVNKERAIELKKGGATYKEIGKLMNCSPVSVFNAIKASLLPTDNLEEFKHTRADILASKQAELLATLTPKAIEKTTPYQAAGMFALLYDKERLERGQSTNNIAVYDVNQGYDQIARERDKLITALGYDPLEGAGDTHQDNLSNIDTVEQDNP